ncbi:hypothetical protein [Fusibacter ferrireducens]|uniref:ParB/Sulfiredoxin domain-containing protein n=1 Tax=Fusibacter ferrireducens TaxID=2785058 RepID=A0ABS0A002_9FIRM|nr:hypothetical protein [Fusibacter ferrireducens]MBF4696028.1 hypothetical protein [Fusibacter ferrireducens]
MKKKNVVKSKRKLDNKITRKHIEIEPGDEFFPNGIFKFHITKLNEHIDENGEEFIVEEIDVNEYFRYFCNEEMNPEYVEAADLNRPVILAEIAPDRLHHGYPTISKDYYSRGYNLIDGHHRLVKAKQNDVEKIKAYIVCMEQHIPFMIEGFEEYVEYWNSKLI